jgi:hypothetical protein
MLHREAACNIKKASLENAGLFSWMELGEWWESVGEFGASFGELAEFVAVQGGGANVSSGTEMAEKLRGVERRDSPDLVDIHFTVLMDQDISHADDVSPWNVWMRVFELRGKCGGGFTNDFDLANNGILCHEIGKE